MATALLRTTLLSLIPSILCAQTAATLALSPDPVTQCIAGNLGRLAVTWNSGGPAPVQILAGNTRVPMTGLEAASGSTSTGDWVGDGTLFVLADASGNELARAMARVACSPFPDAINVALAASSYFPLQVGNSWTYRVNSRSATSTYESWSIPWVESINGTLWFVVSKTAGGSPASETLYREDARGLVYTLAGNGAEQLWLDPTTPRNPAATLQTQQYLPSVPSAVGSFQDGVFYTMFAGLQSETGTYVRGIGLVSSATNLATGSSGGFLTGLDLVDARIGGHLVFQSPANAVQVALEALTLDVTGHHVTNCAVPCYFAACGLAPGSDPSGTYKPCFQARVHLEGTATGGEIDLDLLDHSGTSLFHAIRTVPVAGPWFQQVPLYSVPNQPFPPGAYQVRVQAPLADGAGPAVTTVPITIR